MSEEDFTCGQDDAPGGTSTQPPDPSQYTVKDGDTWEGIATDKNVDPAVLMLVNNVDPTTAPTPPTPGAMIVIPTQQHDACIAPGPDNSNRVCSDPTPPDLLVITPVSDDVVQGQPLLVEAQNIMTDPAASAFASGLADKPWATVAISGHTSTKVMTGANANYAKADFANAFHAALKSSYKELGAASREDFWARSGIVELGFFRPLVKSKSSHHTLGCAVDLDVRCNHLYSNRHERPYLFGKRYWFKGQLETIFPEVILCIREGGAIHGHGRP